MPDTPPCPTCGSAVPPGSPGGACPRCLLAAGLESGPAAERAAPPTPEEMARHFPGLEILEVLGQGGMGIVYRARHRSLDRMVALKVLPPEAAREPGFPERFTREARTLARLQHPHIVGVHDFGETGGLYWLVMEYVDGPNLRQVLREGSLEPKQALAIVPQVCDALQYAHEQGIVHRDIKPENILLDRAGRVKIADFGLARIVQRAPVDLTLTREGQVLGTLHYMAPEQYRAPDTVDHRADIYSLGVVFYEMLTGDLPMGVFPPPSRKQGVDARLDGIVMRALEKERDQRWQHASDVRTRVDSIAAGPDAAPPEAAPEGGKRTRVKVGPLEVDVEKGPGGRTVKVAGLDLEEARAAGAEVEEDGHGNVRLVFRKAWREESPDAPLSRLAVAGALAIPAGLLAALLLGAFLRLTGAGADGDAAAFYTFLLVGAAGWIASVAAWWRIRRSGGALRGRRWAMAGTLATPLLLCCPAGLVMAPAPGSLRDIVQEPGFRGDRLPPLFTEGGTRRAHSVLGGPPQMMAYHRESVVREMDDLWSTTGAALLHQAYAGGEEGRVPSAWSVRYVALAPDGWAGRVVVSDGKRTLAFPVLHDGTRWTVPEGDREERGGPPVEGDRDGRILDGEEAGRNFRITRPADAALVTVPVPGMTEEDRADLVVRLRNTWLRSGREFLAQRFPLDNRVLRFPGMRLFAVALRADGLYGRMVWTDGSAVVAVPIVPGIGFWEIADEAAEWLDRPADDSDLDGFLGAGGPGGGGWPAPTEGRDTPFSTDPSLAADACLVHGLPAGRSAEELAAVARAVRALWREKGPEYVRRTVPSVLPDGPPSRIPGNASDYALFAVAVAEDGRSARAVLFSATLTISVPLERDGDAWVLGESGWESRFSPPGKGDEDGFLFR